MSYLRRLFSPPDSDSILSCYLLERKRTSVFCEGLEEKHLGPCEPHMAPPRSWSAAVACAFPFWKLAFCSRSELQPPAADGSTLFRDEGWVQCPNERRSEARSRPRRARGCGCPRPWALRSASLLRRLLACPSRCPGHRSPCRSSHPREGAPQRSCHSRGGRDLLVAYALWLVCHIPKNFLLICLLHFKLTLDRLCRLAGSESTSLQWSVIKSVNTRYSFMSRDCVFLCNGL